MRTAQGQLDVRGIHGIHAYISDFYRASPLCESRLSSSKIDHETIDHFTRSVVDFNSRLARDCEFTTTEN
jgi:hypothetical protein